MADTKEKRAPVQGYVQGIPWELHLEAYNAYSKKWSPQPALIDLEGRNCRGGFSTGELDMFIPGWREKVSVIAQLKAEIADLRVSLESALTEKDADAVRLDFVIENETSWYPGYYDGAWQKDKRRGTLCYGKNQTEGVTMREAIDAALQSAGDGDKTA